MEDLAGLKSSKNSPVIQKVVSQAPEKREVSQSLESWKLSEKLKNVLGGFLLLDGMLQSMGFHSQTQLSN